MDTQRLLLFIALGLVLFMIWQTWQLEHAPQIKKPTISGKLQPPKFKQKSNSADIPEATQTQTEVEVPGSFDVFSKENANTISISSDVLELKINPDGGYINKASLLQYPVDIKRKDQPFTLLDTKLPFFIAETGIRGLKSQNAANFPGHTAKFVSEKTVYSLTGDKIRVPLKWVNAPDDIEINKVFILKPGSYEVTVEYEVKNNSAKNWTASIYGQLQREGLLESEERGLTNYSYTGGVYYTAKDAYNKVDFAELADKNLKITTKDSWAGFIQHYFVGAVLPKADSNAVIYSYRPGNKYAIGILEPSITIKPGDTGKLGIRFYLGPKTQDKLKAAAKGLELTVDYGWLTFIAEPLFWLLEKIQNLVKNWGVAIILITLLIKLVFYKLSETSYRSMARMRKLQPRLQQLKERFGDDKTKLNEAMMKMYREEKVNPMGGCLPIVVQIPVFIALYWVLMESVELRQASFLWLEDLSIKDPYFILPIIMGASMFIQQKLNPAPIDPMQAKIMMALPLVFTVFFAFFPAGLVLYWVVNNIISIAQQWVITKRIAG